MTTEIVNFLLARFAEDKTDAEELIRQHERWQREQVWNGADGTQGSIVASLVNPRRVLADLEAKQAIVEEYQETAAADPSDVSARVAHFAFGITLCLFASVYADHPDYQPEWAQ